MKHTIKTEHGGPKKRKGYWGRKKEAKTISRKKRRQISRQVTNSELDG
ncbi:MAG: hypothetical protein HYU99_06685 [Deltaproteobacteria bacterium]|nr:hypothetical protein [Deltaproteobacteria bacterium]